MDIRDKRKVRLEFNFDISVKVPFTDTELEAFKKLKKKGEYKKVLNEFASNLKEEILEGIEEELEPKVNIKQAKAKLVK